MEDYPKTIIEFQERIATEEACLRYLESFRWPDGFLCPYCGHDKKWHTKDGLYKCRKCWRRTSLTSGTIFHDTPKPLRLWFEAMWHIKSQKYGANAVELQRVLAIGSYHTAWQWLHKLRHTMVRPGRDKLLGTVEVDESLVGGKHSGKRGRGAEHKELAAIAVEDKGGKRGKGIGRIRLRRIPDASADTLGSYITANVVSGSQIRTDGWASYPRLKSVGYDHEVVESRELIIVHLIASLLKRWLLGTYQGAVRASHLGYFLDEYTFRFNRRSSASRGKLFYRLVHQKAMADPTGGQHIGGQHIAGDAWDQRVLDGGTQNQLTDVPFLRTTTSWGWSSQVHTQLEYFTRLICWYPRVKDKLEEQFR